MHANTCLYIIQVQTIDPQSEKTCNLPNEGSDHTARMHRLIRFFAGPACPKVFSDVTFNCIFTFTRSLYSVMFQIQFKMSWRLVAADGMYMDTWNILC